MLVSIGYGVRACLGFQTGVRDFRREAGAWNMVEKAKSNVQLAGSVTFLREPESRLNGIVLYKFWM
jgi:NAD-dependent SIR2 family protein deacetylase